MTQDALSKGNRDAVDAILDQWAAERPDLDASAKGITGRIVRLADLFQQAFREAFEPLGITDGEYGILVALRRAGEPHALTPTELARHRMMTSGGMTAAIDRLERKGLLRRAPNPSDRRGSLVCLTPDGLRTVNAAMELHVAAEQDLVGALTKAERAALERALRTLALDRERS